MQSTNHANKDKHIVSENCVSGTLEFPKNCIGWKRKSIEILIDIVK